MEESTEERGEQRRKESRAEQSRVEERRRSCMQHVPCMHGHMHNPEDETKKLATSSVFAPRVTLIYVSLRVSRLGGHSSCWVTFTSVWCLVDH